MAEPVLSVKIAGVAVPNHPCKVGDLVSPAVRAALATKGQFATAVAIPLAGTEENLPKQLPGAALLIESKEVLDVHKDLEKNKAEIAKLADELARSSSSLKEARFLLSDISAWRQSVEQSFTQGKAALDSEVAMLQSQSVKLLGLLEKGETAMGAMKEFGVAFHEVVKDLAVKTNSSQAARMLLHMPTLEEGKEKADTIRKYLEGAKVQLAQDIEAAQDELNAAQQEGRSFKNLRQLVNSLQQTYSMVPSSTAATTTDKSGPLSTAAGSSDKKAVPPSVNSVPPVSHAHAPTSFPPDATPNVIPTTASATQETSLAQPPATAATERAMPQAP